MSLNAIDLCSIQESLVAYKRLLEWLPITSKEEADFKANRIDIINHLMRTCGSELEKLSETYRNEE